RSSVYRGPAVGRPAADYLNLVVALATESSVDELRDELRAIETLAGRTRADAAVCELDLDLLLYGCRVDAERRLPRPGILALPFVLVPLAELAPELVHPITGQKLAGDVRGVANEEQHRRCDVLGLAGALERRLLDDRRAQRVGHSLSFVGPENRARRHAVHADVGAEIFGERARQHREPGFGRAVDGMVAQRPLRVHVDDIDDDAARRAQGRHESLGEEQRRLEIAAEEIVPLLERDGADRRGIEVRRVVDEHVEPAARALEHLRGHALDCGDVAHVGADRERRLRATAIQLGGQLLGFGCRAVVVDRDVRAGRVQRARDDGANALRRTRHERGAPVEAHLSFRTRHPSLQRRRTSPRLHYRDSHDFEAMSRANLPVPSDEASQQSAALIAKIRDEIERAGGWIDFAHYMQLALYAPGLGYYSAGSLKIGAAGDFVTAPELSRSFGRAIALTLDAELTALGSNDVIELGAGSGALAAQLLDTFALLGREVRYWILEPSADLRQRQQRALEAFAGKVVWLDRLPES